MLKLLDGISDAAWDRCGIGFGAVGAATIAWQVWYEWRQPGPSTVSMWFVGGFFSVYLFWFLYGLRFRRPGIYLSNGAAVLLQLLFAGVVLMKS
jgi:hypothetical protein